MRPVKIADTDTLKDLNAVSIEHSLGVCISDEGIANLTPDGLHAGVVAGISRNQRSALMAWFLAVENHGPRPLVQMSLPIERVRRLPDGELTDEAVEYAVQETRKYLAELKEEEAFWQQGLDEIERLTAGE